MHGKARLALLGLVAVLAVACANSGATTTGRSDGSAQFGAVDAKGAPVPAAQNATTPGNGIPTLLINPDRNLIQTANIVMRSQDPWTTADKARQIARSLGGDVLALTESGQGDTRSASITVRVPSTAFEQALAQLKLLDGEVVQSNAAAKDVTDQYTDLQARLVAKQAEEARYLQLLPQAKTVDDTLKIDAALANVRTQIEQLQGQVNLIRNRTDYSTISMSITPLAPVPGEPATTWDASKTFARALAALTAFFRVAADLAIWTLVFGWVPLLALAFALLATRVRRPGVSAS